MSTATLQRYRLEDIADLQSDVAAMPTKRDQVTHLSEQYPHMSWSFLSKNVGALLALDPEQFLRVLQHSDPTGETAARRADMAVAS